MTLIKTPPQRKLTPKEPLVALALSLIFSGLGQIYVGKVLRGFLWMGARVIISFIAILYVIEPSIKTSFLVLLVPIVIYCLSIFFTFDAYFTAKKYNVDNGLERNLTLKRKIALILSIAAFLWGMNPIRYATNYVLMHIQKNYVSFDTYPDDGPGMKPVILPKDAYLANREIYKNSAPQRGDVVLFTYDKVKNTYVVKRIVGLPGEIVEIKNGKILIDGGVLSGGAFNNNFYYNSGYFGAVGTRGKVNENCYYVLADNSKESSDSREYGCVPRADIFGKAYKIIYPFNRSGPIK